MDMRISEEKAKDVLTDAQREDAASADVLLTVKEYAALFRRHPQTVYRAIAKQTLPQPVERPTGGQILIRVERVIVTRLRAA